MIHLVVLYFLVISTANGQTACNTARAALAANAQCEQTITMVVESVSNLILVSAESAAQACSINCKPLYEDMIAECESGVRLCVYVATTEVSQESSLACQMVCLFAAPTQTETIKLHFFAVTMVLAIMNINYVNA